jgi:protein phosphatase
LENVKTISQDKQSPEQSLDSFSASGENEISSSQEGSSFCSDESETNKLSDNEILPEKQDDQTEDSNLELDTQNDQNENTISTVKNSEFLEEQTYEREPPRLVGNCLLVLSDYLHEDESLEMWMQDDHSISERLFVVTQVCQFSRLLHQKGWCLIDIDPRSIQVSKPLNFYECSGIYPIDETLNHGMVGGYCAPELAFNQGPVNESMACYSLGALFYQLIHKRLPSQNDQSSQNTLEIERIPQIYQVLKICLAQNPDKRFSLSQLLDILINIRQGINTTKASWEIASSSTVGLSTSRLQNEDNFGVRQQQLSNSQTLLIGIVADGMGGMAEGEVASKIAVQTALDEPLPQQLKIGQECASWLEEIFQKANQSIANTVRDGGTTFSLILALNRDLMIAHVGDSRIYLIRNENIYKLTEDHSLVEMLVASGQITEEEKDSHPDRNVLTKSLGSNRRLNDGYVQLVNRFSNELYLSLEVNDIILLCSDGVWDLVQEDELLTMVNQYGVMEDYVNDVINLVLDRGAQDNATLLALKLVS